MKNILKSGSLVTFLVVGLVVSVALVSSVVAQGVITPVTVLNTSVLDTGMVTEQAVPNGSLRVLIQAANPTSGNPTAFADGVPDLGTFDFGTDGTIPVTCPVDPVPGYTFGAPTAQAGAVFLDHNKQEITDVTVLADIQSGVYAGSFTTYHVFTCPYTGTGEIGANFQSLPDGSQNTGIVIGNTSSALINPTRDAASAALLPDTNASVSVTGFLQNLNSSGKVISSVEVLVSAQVNRVLVTARTVGEISFRIVGVPEASQTACNLPGSGTTATVIDFGSPTLNTFADAAQQLQIVSSVTGGYSVSIAQNDQMGRRGIPCPGADGLLDESSTPRVNRDCIPDFFGASTTVASAFNDPVTQKGLGYTVVRAYATNDFSSTGADFDDGNAYRQLPDTSVDESPVAIASSSAPTDSDVYDICYRLTPDAANHAGVYENQINYYVTANF